MQQTNSIERELDARHAKAQAAFSRRDISAYCEMFSPTLAYQQLNGRVIGCDQLMRDVAAQFRQLSSAESSFTREAMRVTDSEVTETLMQAATAETSAFGFIHRRWKLNRRATYCWTKRQEIWTIERVTVHSETMVSAGWSFSVVRR
jgi:hypothetical protein